MSAYKTVVVDQVRTRVRAVRSLPRSRRRRRQVDHRLSIPTSTRGRSRRHSEGRKLQGGHRPDLDLARRQERAHNAGAKNVEERPIVSASRYVGELADEEKADLLVIGNVGLSTIARVGCWLYRPMSRRAQVDVLIVHHLAAVTSTARTPFAELGRSAPSSNVVTGQGR